MELTDDEDFGELVHVMLNRRRPQQYRQRDNHYTKWNNTDFRARFRLSKEIVRFLVNKIADNISPVGIRNHERNHTLSPAEMVFITLRLFATGSFLQVTGDFTGIDKATASRVVNKVTTAIARLKVKYINMPITEDDMNVVRQGFFNTAKFLRCMGAIDCTHIKIQSPGGPNAEQFRNRRGYF